MINHYHSVSIYVGGERVDLMSAESINMRMNRILYDPVTLLSTQAEYSFSFDVPATPKNRRIFGYADNLAITARFTRHIACKVYADETLIFDGTLSLSGYDASNKVFKCNLVSLKIYTIDSIFEDTPLDALDWYEPYSGATSINAYNADMGKKVFYPFVAYGVFEKDPYFSDEVADDYTDARELDKWCRFYPETFPPSLNLVETVRRCFSYKGFELKGDILGDPVMNNIYMSTSLADDQAPLYNLGNPMIGSVDISIQWKNGTVSGSNVTNKENGIIQSLNYPYFRVYNIPTSGGGMAVYNNIDGEYFNFEEIEQFNVMDGNGVVTENFDSYMYDPDEHCIVIPNDGFYKIELEIDAQLQNYNGNIVRGLQQHVDSSQTIAEEMVNIPYRLKDNTPFEIQLVRNVLNSEDGATIELIKGKYNKEYFRGLPYSGGSETQYRDWNCCYPHEWRNPRYFRNPTTSDAPTAYSNDSFGGRADSSSGGRGRVTPPGVMTYLYKQGEPMAYDPVVSPYFICGFSTMSDGVFSVIKDGRSWYKGDPNRDESLYNSTGYQMASGGSNSYQLVDSSLNSNEYINAPNSYVSITGNRMKGKIYCSVFLKRNDILTLNMVHRYYDAGRESGSGYLPYENEYFTTLSARLKIDAFTPRNHEYIRQNGLGYYTPTEFDTDLRVSNFLSSGTTMAEFVSNFIKAFNLDFYQEGNSVFINGGKALYTKDKGNLVNLDDRVDAGDAISSSIDWPSAMSVRWNIDTDEYGYWTTVPAEYVNDRDWASHGDSGYTEIKIDPYGVDTQEVEIGWSYDWYDTFNLIAYSGDTETGSTALRIPVIGDYQYLAPGADYGEAMKHDELSKTLRLWFRQEPSESKVTLTSNEDVYLSLPVNRYEGINISYKDTEPSLLNYFNISPAVAGNYVTVNAYLEPDEYLMLKNGAGIRFDDDVYDLVEMTGYDPSGANPTELKMMRRIC